MTHSPQYTPSLRSPSYSEDPMRGEITLASTLRPSSIRRTSSGTFSKDFGNISLNLERQDSTTTIPTYPQNGLVAGSITVKEPRSVLQVRLKFVGKLKLNVSGFLNEGCKYIETVNQNFILWSSCSSPAETACPESLAFAARIPSTFRDGDAVFSLPPSYETNSTGLPSFCASASYHLKVVISRSSMWNFTTKKSFRLPINYLPRSRPPQPVLNGRNFLSTVKVLPEEWYQSSSVLKPRFAFRNVVRPVDVNFFVPVVRIFGISDTIPVHIHFCGPLSSLQVVHSRLLLEDERVTRWGRKNTSMVLSVELRRQVSVEFEGRSGWKNWVIGSGILRPSTPPFYCHTRGSCSTHDNEEMDWEGEVRCKADVRIGRFDSGCIALK
ncbi:hypothetical protein Moror_8649, partial [Moniliophthora roreri MCA 2997]